MDLAEHLYPVGISGMSDTKVKSFVDFSQSFVEDVTNCGLGYERNSLSQCCIIAQATEKVTNSTHRRGQLSGKL